MSNPNPPQIKTKQYNQIENKQDLCKSVLRLMNLNPVILKTRGQAPCTKYAGEDTVISPTPDFPL